MKRSLILLLSWLAACGGSSEPQRALYQYGAALDDGNYARAYGFMSEEFRGEVSLEEFKRMLQGNQREAAETARRLRTSPADVQVTADFHYGTGDRIRLVEEGGRWRIDSDPLQFYSQKTPHEALRSFIRAYRLKRWQVMLRFVPSAYAERMDAGKIQEQFDGPGREEMASRISMLEANLDAAIAAKGNQAKMAYGDKFEVSLVREAGLWKIRDID